jgi:hypothetical protein
MGTTSSDTVNVRVFLACFMIAFRPTYVFETMGSLEMQLFEVGGALMAAFERITGAVERFASFAAVPADVTEGFTQLLFSYLRHFKAWKIPDEVKLSGRIKHGLVALYGAERQLPLNEPADSRLKVELHTQIERLRGKLSQIAGPAALVEFDEQLLHAPLAHPQQALARLGGSVRVSERLTNEQLAHELLLDPAFQLSDADAVGGDDVIMHRIRKSFHRAFWDSLADDLRLAQPCYTRVLRILRELRDGVSELEGGGADPHGTAIATVIDIDFITARVELGAMPWVDAKHLVGGIVTVMRRIQSPLHDFAMLEKWREVDIRMIAAGADDYAHVLCGALEFLVDRLNAMRIDAANARLRLIAPVIRDHGVDYERGKFQDKLNDGSLTLQRTTQWIDRALRALRLEVARGVLAGNADAFLRVHSRAMLSLVVGTEPLSVEALPETLCFDGGRLANMRLEFERVVTGSSTLVYTTQTLVDGAAAPTPPQRKLLSDLTKLILDDELDTASFDRLLDGAGMLMDPHGRKLLHGTVARGLNPADPVRQLIAVRVTSALEEFMHPASTVSDDAVHFVNPARALIPSIRSTAAKLAALAHVNRDVHLHTYNATIAERAKIFA